MSPSDITGVAVAAEVAAPSTTPTSTIPDGNGDPPVGNPSVPSGPVQPA